MSDKRNTPVVCVVKGESIVIHPKSVMGSEVLDCLGVWQCQTKRS